MALIRCPECNERVSDIADYCPSCGIALGEGRREAKPEPEPTLTRAQNEKAGLRRDEASSTPRVAKRSDWSGRLGCLIVLLVLSGLVAFSFFYQNLTLGTYTPTNADAYDFAVINIKRKLSSRASVRFPPLAAVDSRSYGGNTFAFQGAYHMKFPQSEQVSKAFSATVQYVGSGGNNFDDWSIVNMNY